MNEIEQHSENKIFYTWSSICFNNNHCPQLFSFSSVTVRMSAEEFFGQKYEKFSKKLMENRRNEKNIVNVLLNNQIIKQNSKQASFSSQRKSINNQNKDDFVAKVSNTSLSTDLLRAYEHYKPLNDAPDLYHKQNIIPQVNNHKDSMCSPQLPINNGRDVLDDISNVCSNIYQKNSNKSGLSHLSYVVPNRIKTNGSLSREKLSLYQRELLDNAEHISDSSRAISNGSNVENNINYGSSNYANNTLECRTVRLPCDDFYNKFPTHSSRNKIRTTCNSPKRNGNILNNLENFEDANEFDNLLKSLDENMHVDTPTDLEEKIGQKFSRNAINTMVSAQRTHLKTPYVNCMNSAFLQLHDDAHLLKYIQNDLLFRIYSLKSHISNLQEKQSEVWKQIHMKPSLVLIHFFRMYERSKELDNQLQTLKEKIYRLEAQHSATRVIEENKQAKLKYTIVMKQDQITRLKEMLEHNPHDTYFKMELHKLRDALENDQKMFEDLEFQYLEEEADWDSYRDELNAEEKILCLKLQENYHDMRYMWNIISKNGNYLCLLDQLPLNEIFNKKVPKIIQSKWKNMVSVCNNSIENVCLKKVSYTNDNRNNIRAQVVFNDLELLPTSHTTTSKDVHKTDNNNIDISIKKLENSVSLKNTKIETFNAVSNLEEKLEEKQQFMNDHNAEDNYRSNTDKLSTHATTEVFTSPTFSIADVAIKSREVVNALEGLLEFIQIDKSNYYQGHDYLSRKLIMSKLNDRKHSKSWNDLQHNRSKNKTCLTVQNDKKKQVSSDNDSNKAEMQNFKHSTNFKSSLLVLSSMEMGSRRQSFNTCRMDKQPDNYCDTSVCNMNSNGNVNNGQSKRALLRHQRPLTRYLPIFSSDLNLREHIESAGHQVRWCPHIFIDCHSCRGYLYKLGATFHTWSKRWFVLDREKSIFAYYANKMEGKPKGGEYFSNIEEVYLDHLNVSKNNRPECTFIVKAKKRSYHLQASSSATARIWIDAIITGAQGNVEY